MLKQRRIQLAGVVVLVAVAATAILLAGCTQAPSPSVQKKGPTALGSLAAAKSSLSTTAPDAKLLVVQTAQPVVTTATPVWAYLFGSPSSDKTWIVYVANGVSMGAQDYGTAGLSAADWAKVPGTDQWKVDSDVAYQKALAVSGAKGAPDNYMMGFITYKAADDTSTLQAFVWNVFFEPGKSGATTQTIDVSAVTGDTSIAKP